LISTTEFIMMCSGERESHQSDVSKNSPLTSQTNHVNFR